MRGQFAGLEDKAAARRQRRGDLPGRLQQRVVPWRDQGADTHGLVLDSADHRGAAGIHHPAGILAGELAEVLEAIGDVVHVDFAFHQALARVQRLRAREVILALAQPVGHVDQERAALQRRLAGPFAGVEGCPGSLHSAGGILSGSLGDSAHQFAVGRAVDVPGAAVGRCSPAAADDKAFRCSFRFLLRFEI